MANRRLSDGETRIAVSFVATVVSAHPPSGSTLAVRPLNIPDPFRSNSGLAEKGSNNKAGGLRRPPLLLFGPDIVYVVDLRELLLYNIKQR